MAGNAGGPNTTIRLIDIPANGNLKTIVATGPTRAFKVSESVITAEGANNNPQGFQYKVPNDGSAAGFTTLFARAATGDFDQRNFIAEHGPYGEVFAGAGNSQAAGIGATAATPLIKIQSATATATTIEITEYF